MALYDRYSFHQKQEADNEKGHAKLFFSLLKGGEAEIVAAYPAGVIGNTAANFKAAAEGENLEWTTLYENFGDVAKKEGFPEAYETFSQVARVEKFHEARYLALLKAVNEGKVFKKDIPVK